MRCPICKRGNAAKNWEVLHQRTWTGEYTCPRCGPMKMCGHVKRHTGFETRSSVSFIPACSSCGIDPVVPFLPEWFAADGKGERFQCMVCGERMEIRDRKVVRGRNWSVRREEDTEGLSTCAC